MKERAPSKQQQPNQQNQPQGRTNVPGQNPKQNDSPDHDLYHDENRQNQFDPEVAEALKQPKKEEK